MTAVELAKRLGVKPTAVYQARTQARSWTPLGLHHRPVLLAMVEAGEITLEEVDQMCPERTPDLCRAMTAIELAARLGVKPAAIYQARATARHWTPLGLHHRTRLLAMVEAGDLDLAYVNRICPDRRPRWP